MANEAPPQTDDAGHHSGTPLVTVLEDREQIAPLLIGATIELRPFGGNDLELIREVVRLIAVEITTPFHMA